MRTRDIIPAAVRAASAIFLVGVLALACATGERAVDFGRFRIERQDLRVAVPGERYEAFFTGKGGLAPYIDWHVVDGALPGGLKLHGDGRLDGTVEAEPGLYVFTVEATDSDLVANTDRETFVLRVGDPDEPGPLRAQADAFEGFLAERHAPSGLVLTLLNADADAADRQWDDYELAARQTGLYLAAAAFRFAVTQSEDSLDRVRATVQAIDRLHRITGKPGLIARGYAEDAIQLLCCDEVGVDGCTEEDLCGGVNFPEYRKGEGEFAGYHWIGDPGRLDYEAIVFGLSIAAALVDDEEVRAPAGGILAAIADHVWGNDLAIVDTDGEVTTDGDVSGERVGDLDEPNGLSALFSLTWMQAAYRASDQARFKDRFEVLLGRGYLSIMAGTLRAYRGYQTDWPTVHAAFLAYFDLIRMEKDAARRNAWKNQIFEHLWQDAGGALDERRAESERNVWFNLLFGQATDEWDPEVTRDNVLETASFPPAPRTNHRVDLTDDPAVEKNPEQEGWAVDPLPVADRAPAPFVWEENPYLLVGGADDGREFAGVDFLLPYWMAIFYDRLGPAL